MSDEQTNLAQVKDLSVSFMTDAGSIKAIDKISFTIPKPWWVWLANQVPENP